MASLRSKQTGRILGAIADDDVAFLRANLESDSVEFTEFYLDASTVDLLESAGASPTLVSLLRALLRNEESIDVELVDAAPDDGAPRAVEAGTENGVDIPRYHLPPYGSVLMPEITPLPDPDDDVPDPPPAKAPLHCLICGNSEFDHRRVQLHGPVATIFNVEWLGKVADCQVCRSCGYMHWFLR